MAAQRGVDPQSFLCTLGNGDQHWMLVVADVEGGPGGQSGDDPSRRPVVPPAHEPLRPFRLETSVIQSAVYCSVRRPPDELFRLADVSIADHRLGGLDAVDFHHKLSDAVALGRRLRHALCDVRSVVESLLQGGKLFAVAKALAAHLGFLSDYDGPLGTLTACQLSHPLHWFGHRVAWWRSLLLAESSRFRTEK